MTVFKGFLTITKRNLHIMFLYMSIFITLCIMIQNIDAADPVSSFSQESLDIAVIDCDGGKLAGGLTSYLDQYHTIKDIPDDASAIQDNLFYREVYYIVTIPEDFEKKCLSGNEKLSVTKVPGSNSGYYVDRQINTYLHDIKILTKSGFSLEESIAKVKSYPTSSAEVHLLDKNGHGGRQPTYAYMYQFIPYILMSILCYSLGYIMIAFNKTDLRKRMLCSAVSAHSQNMQLVLGYTVVGLAIWVICILLSFVLYGKDLADDPNLIFYMINSFLVMLVSLSLSFLVGTLVHKDDLLSAVVNVITLGMSFTCGVFVSLDIMGKGVKMAAHFLPLYWYEINNKILANNQSLSHAQLRSLYTGFGIQLLFAAAILCITLVIGRSLRKADS